MKKTIAIFVVITLASLVTWRFVQSDGHEPIAPVVDESQVILVEYTWNGTARHISLADLNAAIAKLPPYRQRNFKTRADRAEYLEEVIDERLKRHRAEDEGYDTLAEHLDKLEDYTYQLMVEKLTEEEVDSQVSYTDADLMAYYQANMGEYIEKARARATCITLDDEDFANETLDAILAGKDIVEIAKELSEAGKLANGPGTNPEDPGNTNMFTRAASARWSEFIDAVFEQEIGEITETVFETEVNDETFYLIFRKEEHRPERQKEFEEVKVSVERTVDRNKRRERLNEWVAEVTAENRLKTYPENIPAPLNPEDAETDESDE